MSCKPDFACSLAKPAPASPSYWTTWAWHSAIAPIGGSFAQVLVVTHAPQVAAGAGHHLRVQKAATRGSANVSVTVLDAEERREEIARMLAGAEITDAARAAADRLLARSA